MTYGESKAVLILTAHKLNYAVGFLADAKDLLIGKEIAPIKMRRFETEANYLCDQILRDDKQEEAEDIASGIINKYNLKTP